MNTDWLDTQGLARLPEFLPALAIGLLIGLERERNPTAKEGLRTFALVALAGAAAATLAKSGLAGKPPMDEGVLMTSPFRPLGSV